MNLKPYIQLARLDKPIGIFLLLWPTLWAVWMASAGRPNLWILFIFCSGVIIMRSAGCVINDIWDRDFDGSVKRTKNRPLAAKTISVKKAIIFFFMLITLALIFVLFLNSFTITLAVVGLLLTVIYPLLKRVTSLPQVGLSFAFAWGIPMAFAAIQNHIPPIAWLLFASAGIWTLIYDTQYAMVDREDDINIGIKSTAILFRIWDIEIIGFLQILFLLLLCCVGFLNDYKIYYYSSLILVALLFGYQQYLMQKRIPNAYFKAFLNNHWVGCSIFLGLLLSYSS